MVFREPGAASAALLDGLHRWQMSRALGFVEIPTVQASLEDAELVYQYRQPGNDS